ncbi:hypothetical protein [Chryseobacterium sp. T16E-39]|uniref:hypothetical protein n=1 Tax=Chryseobacterium sp. T16E-39 TaxID=2015076 RepID=UPI0012FACD1C|nr:hypothetical protein [Chryseobacterium sp. T16E-39]
MEKLHKYCLSVLLVMICSNISAQSKNCSIEKDTYKRLYEVYTQFLSSQDCKESCLTEKKKLIQYHTIHQKQCAGSLIDIHSHKQSGLFKDKFTGNWEKEIRFQVLEAFEKQSKEYELAEAFFFKRKVSKVRNKDYLDLIS